MEIQIHIFDKQNKHTMTEAIFPSRNKKTTLASELRRAANHAHRVAEEDHPDWGAIEIEIKRD